MLYVKHEQYKNYSHKSENTDIDLKNKYREKYYQNESKQHGHKEMNYPLMLHKSDLVLVFTHYFGKFVSVGAFFYTLLYVVHIICKVFSHCLTPYEQICLNYNKIIHLFSKNVNSNDI